MRPRLRGVSHRIAFYVALVAGGGLVIASRDRITTAIYAVLLAGMFGVSATLHRGGWTPRVYSWLRRADHARIFACVAGSYTPFCVLGMPASSGTRLLALSWTANGLPTCPRRARHSTP